ncbi:MAG: dihydroorotate dehydrogenase (NAD+) catalytic subunit [Phycisphaerales bacterium]|jgi:dihydroorotate dehydrogenase (NAD+) catalytic subunit
MPKTDPILRTTLAGIPLSTPVLCAAGTCGVLDEVGEVVDLRRVGGIVTKSITRRPRVGNETWRVAPRRVGMLNAIGLANPGLVRFLADHARRATDMPCAVVVSVAGFSVHEYAECVAAIDAVEGIRAIELNVSCPNVHPSRGGGVEFGADPGALRDLMRAVRPLARKSRLFVKLSPVAVASPNSATDLARVAINGGADGLVLCNTVPAMGIDVESRRPVLANITGGLSGPAIHEIAVKIVHDVYRGVAREARVPIVGVGGVSTWQDAAEFILAGADAVQVGAMGMADPKSPVRIAAGLAAWARRRGVSEHGSIGELVGTMRPPEVFLKGIMDMWGD